MEDVRAHKRIDRMEEVLTDHIEEQKKLETELKLNTQLTRDIADNTRELVTLFKGAKALRTFVLWSSPVVSAIIAVWAWVQGYIGSWN